MTSLNPYESPVTEAKLYTTANPTITTSTWREPVLPRYFAAHIDLFGSLVIAALAGKMLPDSQPTIQFAAAILAYFSYFLFPEWLFAKTLGKLLIGISVVQLNGKRITFGQACTRTAFRILEVNPGLFGAAPAALCILFSEHRQRIGDVVAGTVVVSKRTLLRLRDA